LKRKGQKGKESNVDIERGKENHEQQKTHPANLSSSAHAFWKTPPNTTEANSPSRYADEDEGSIARALTVRIAPTLSRRNLRI